MVQGVIDSTDGRLSANVFYVADERTGGALDAARRDGLSRSLRAMLMAAAAAAEKRGDAAMRRCGPGPGDRKSVV